MSGQSSTSLTRLTPDVVRDLFAELHATPIQGRWDTQDGTACCVLGALNKRYRQPFNVSGIAQVTGMSYSYLSGVMDGWDGRPADRVHMMHGPSWSQGYDDGQAAWKAMQEWEAKDQLWVG